MTMSTSEARISSAESVQQTLEGTQSTRLRETLRLNTWVSRTCGTSPLLRMRATDCPTVPNPSRATLETSLVMSRWNSTLRTRTPLLPASDRRLRASSRGRRRAAPARRPERAGSPRGFERPESLHSPPEKQKGHHPVWVMAPGISLVSVLVTSPCDWLEKQRQRQAADGKEQDAGRQERRHDRRAGGSERACLR